MTTNTLNAVKAVLATDISVDDVQRKRILALLRNGPAPAESKTESPKANSIIRRKDAAKRLGISTRCLDMWCDQGILQKVRIGKRACGVTEQDIENLIRNTKAQNTGGPIL